MPKFNPTARVNLPGGNGAQAVVMDVTEKVTGFPVYTLRWLDDAGETHTGTVGEGDLEVAQPDVITLGGIKPLVVVIPKPAAVIFKNKPKAAPKRKR